MKDDIATFPAVETIISPPGYIRHLAKHDYVYMSAISVFKSIGTFADSEIQIFCDSWNNLVTDKFMSDGSKYRKCRHAVFSASRGGGAIRQEAHKPHFQSLRLNKLNGGKDRNFEPIEEHIADSTVLHSILGFGSHMFGTLHEKWLD